MHTVEYGKVKHLFPKLKVLFPKKYEKIIKLSKNLILNSESSLHTLDLSQPSLMTAIDWKRLHIYGFNFINFFLFFFKNFKINKKSKALFLCFILLNFLKNSLTCTQNTFILN